MPRILIADDTPDNIRLLEFCLDDIEDCELFTATNGVEALEVAREVHPETILLDVMMPGKDGIQVCREIRMDPKLAQVPIILVTAMSDEDDVVRGLEAGADDYVTKPFNGRIVAARTLAAVQRYTVVSENRRLIHELEEAARKDAMTSLLNRSTFFDVFHHDLMRSVRSGETCSFVMLDIDHFKTINDTYGHLAGDQAIIRVARQLREAARESDAIGRYGGEEFCVLLPDTPLEGAMIWAERCRQSIEAMGFQWEGADVRVTASFGATQTEPGERKVEDVINRADLALLKAKAEGRNRVITADRPIPTPS